MSLSTFIPQKLKINGEWVKRELYFKELLINAKYHSSGTSNTRAVRTFGEDFRPLYLDEPRAYQKIIKDVPIKVINSLIAFYNSDFPIEDIVNPIGDKPIAKDKGEETKQKSEEISEFFDNSEESVEHKYPFNINRMRIGDPNDLPMYFIKRDCEYKDIKERRIGEDDNIREKFREVLALLDIHFLKFFFPFLSLCSIIEEKNIAPHITPESFEFFKSIKKYKKNKVKEIEKYIASLSWMLNNIDREPISSIKDILIIEIEGKQMKAGKFLQKEIINIQKKKEKIYEILMIFSDKYNNNKIKNRDEYLKKFYPPEEEDIINISTENNFLLNVYVGPIGKKTRDSNIKYIIDEILNEIPNIAFNEEITKGIRDNFSYFSEIFLENKRGYTIEMSNDPEFKINLARFVYNGAMTCQSQNNSQGLAVGYYDLFSNADIAVLMMTNNASGKQEGRMVVRRLFNFKTGQQYYLLDRLFISGSIARNHSNETLLMVVTELLKHAEEKGIKIVVSKEVNHGGASTPNAEKLRKIISNDKIPEIKMSDIEEYDNELLRSRYRLAYVGHGYYNDSKTFQIINMENGMMIDAIFKNKLSIVERVLSPTIDKTEETATKIYDGITATTSNGITTIGGEPNWEHTPFYRVVNPHRTTDPIINMDNPLTRWNNGSDNI